MYLDAAPGTTKPGPADDRMYVVDAIKKTPYLESGAHPRYSGVGDGRFYVTEVKGAEVVLWTQGGLAYALVSSLDRQALLECADTLWRLVVSKPGAWCLTSP